MKAPPTAAATERHRLALEVFAAVQQRLGRKLSGVEWQALNPAGPDSAAEVSLVEGEILVTLCNLADGKGVNGKQGTHQRPGLWVLAAQGEAETGWRERLGWWWRLVAPVLGTGIWLGSAGIDPWLIAGIGLPLAVGAWFGAGRILAERAAILRLVREELPGSDILERIGRNDAELAAIEQHMPPPYSLFLRGLASRRLKDRVQLVAAHLDWFLRTPEPYFRWSWLLHLTTLLRIAFALMFLVMYANGIHHNFTGYIIGYFILFTTRYAKPAKVYLQRYFADALALKLQRGIVERIQEQAAAEAAEANARAEAADDAAETAEPAELDSRIEPDHAPLAAGN